MKLKFTLLPTGSRLHARVTQNSGRLCSFDVWPIVGRMLTGSVWVGRTAVGEGYTVASDMSRPKSSENLVLPPTKTKTDFLQGKRCKDEKGTHFPRARDEGVVNMNVWARGALGRVALSQAMLIKLQLTAIVVHVVVASCCSMPHCTRSPSLLPSFPHTYPPAAEISLPPSSRYLLIPPTAPIQPAACFLPSDTMVYMGED